MKLRFKLGSIVMTKGIANLMGEDRHFANFVNESLGRHVQGDWGDLPEEDKKENEFSLDKHLRLLSAYEGAGLKIWIITEADRSATTILFPNEY